MATTDDKGRPIWVVAAESNDAGRFIVQADQELTAFLELESAIQPTDIIRNEIARNWMKNWEVIADNLNKSGWCWRWVSAIDSNERTIWIADAHHNDGTRYIVRADEKLTAFMQTRIGDSSRHFIKSRVDFTAASGCLDPVL